MQIRKSPVIKLVLWPGNASACKPLGQRRELQTFVEQQPWKMLLVDPIFRKRSMAFFLHPLSKTNISKFQIDLECAATCYKVDHVKPNYNLSIEEMASKDFQHLEFSLTTLEITFRA